MDQLPKDLKRNTIPLIHHWLIPRLRPGKRTEDEIPDLKEEDIASWKKKLTR